jgi:glycosyltransferase involved in cell wall biosynthesis
MRRENDDLLVDVLMITYGHEKFIEQAVEGVILQQTNFTFRLLIFDDCSPDKTEEIVKSLLNHHNTNLTIVYKRNQRNLGMYSNGMQSLKAVEAKYVALCEGDDYWTDPYKLQKQVDYLGNNPNSAGCFHHAYMIHTSGEDLNKLYHAHVSNYKKYNQETALTWLGSSYATCSLMFRASILLDLPLWFIKNPCDEFLDLLITNYGSLDFIDEKMSVYRISGEGVWTKINATKQMEELLNRALILNNEETFKAKYSKFLSKKIKNLSTELTFDRNLDKKKRFHYFSIVLRFTKFNRFGHYLFVIRFLIDPIYNIGFSKKIGSPAVSGLSKKNN